MSDETEVVDTHDQEVSQEVVQEPIERSMDDTIRETLEKIEGRGSEETEEQRAERLRDEKGRFAKVDSETPAPQAEVQAQEVQDQVETPVTVPPELQRLGLRKEEAEAFAKAPEAVKQAFIRRSEEMHRGIEQFRSKAQFGDSMERAITPFLPTLQSLGVTPDVAVQKLMSADNALRYGSQQQKVQMLTQIARDYGVDLGQAQEYHANTPMADPQVQALQSQVQQLQGWIQQQNQAREWQERETLNSEIERFAQSPEHVYFDKVRGEMAGLLQAGLASDLKDAYEKAIYANPTIRSQVLAKQQAEAEEKRRADAALKAQEAKRSASVNVSRKATLPTAKAVGTMDDTIREAAQKLGLIS